MVKDAQGARDYDWWLLAIVATICALGVVEIYSATHGSALAGMHTKQIRWLVIGFVLMFALSRLDYHVIMDQAPWSVYRGTGGADSGVAGGAPRFGARRWIPILGGILSGVRNRQIDYNHSVGTLLCGSAHG